MTNSAIFKFSITPNLFFLFTQSNITDLKFQMNGIQNLSWSFAKGLLTIEVKYDQTL